MEFLTKTTVILMQYLTEIPKFFTWLIQFLAKPLGIAVWSIALIGGGGYYGHIQRDNGFTERNADISADSLRIITLETKVDNLSDKLANRDCSGEVEKYMNLIQMLQLQTSQNREEIQKRLELEKKKTVELENLKQSLKPE